MLLSGPFLIQKHVDVDIIYTNRYFKSLFLLIFVIDIAK